MRGTRERSAVLLDRQPIWLDAMERLLASVDVVAIGRASDVDDAIELVGELRPDVFVAGVDISSPDDVGCVRRAKQAHPDVKAVVVGASTNPEEIDVFFAAGANVYCVRTATHADLASAIRQVFQQSIFLTGVGSGMAAPIPVNTAADELTPREHEILRLVAEGHSNSQLAKMLWVTEQTVKFHLSNIYRKLDVANRTEASRWAQVHGLLPPLRGTEMSGAAA
jgi:DNA-binding NarL/FixJ family response regulator